MKIEADNEDDAMSEIRTQQLPALCRLINLALRQLSHQSCRSLDNIHQAVSDKQQKFKAKRTCAIHDHPRPKSV